MLAFTLDLPRGDMRCSGSLPELDSPLPASLQELIELVHPDDRAFVSEQLERARKTGEYEVQHRLRTAAGSVRWVLSKGRVADSPSGDPLRLTGVLLDVTERERAEEARRLLAAIVESSRDAIIGYSLDGAITAWNRGAEELYGYSAEEAVGRPVSMLTPPEIPDDGDELRDRLGGSRSISTRPSASPGMAAASTSR
jgi:PAS domain-containing protein